MNLFTCKLQNSIDCWDLNEFLCHAKVIGPLIDIHSDTHVFRTYAFKSLKFNSMNMFYHKLALQSHHHY